MDSNVEKTTITRALLALVSAIDEIDDVLVVLATTEDPQELRKQISEHVKVSRKFRDECLEHIQALVNLLDRNRE
jgi:hypothetical protein